MHSKHVKRKNNRKITNPSRLDFVYIHPSLLGALARRCAEEGVDMARIDLNLAHAYKANPREDAYDALLSAWKNGKVR